MSDRRTGNGRPHDELAKLTRDIWDGRLSRRAFASRAAALGVSASVASTIFSVYNARPAAAGPPSSSRRAASRQDDLADATRGGTLRFARAEDSTHFDPITAPLNVDIWILQSVYEQLVRVAPNGLELEPALAERWEISPDGLTYTFHLRPGLLFSDGTPVKASDVKFSVERAKNDPSQTWTFSLVALKEITTPDDATVVMTLNQPWAPFLADVAMFNSSVMPEAWAKGNEERLATEMLGTGPFMLAEWQKDEYILLTRNPNYWDEGLPLLDEVRIAKVPDDNNRILQLQSGEIDAMSDVPFSRVAELEGDPNLQVLKLPGSYTQYVVLNHNHEPLDDVNVRLALNYATDKAAVVDVVLFGNGEPATTYMPKGMLYWNDELPGFPFDLAKAKEHLARSKAPDGFDLELVHLAGVVEYEQLAATLKDMWAQIGVNVQIAPTEQSIYYDAWANETYQALEIYWTNDIIDPDQVTAAAIYPEGLNAFHTAWSNPEAVDLARRAASELDPEQRQAMYFRIQELYNQDAPVILVYYKPFLDAVAKTVHNFEQPPTGQYVWKRTWIEQ